jgi:flagellar biosynthesis GTPase FlhF
MGPTGSGKSSVSSIDVYRVTASSHVQFIATATGAEVRIGHDLQSFTTDISIVKFQSLERTDFEIVFVDTPGFDDTHKTDIEILKMLAEWLKTT